MDLKKTFFGLVLTSVFFFSSAFNADVKINGPWKFIGDKNVGFGVDHDVIHCGNVNDDFRQIRLKVTDGPLKIYDMKIYFDNGSVQDVSLRSQIPQGGQSRIIDLEGGIRHLNKIEFWYETKGFARGRSRVAVWGRL
jgi:hypothetical protein